MSRLPRVLLVDDLPGNLVALEAALGAPDRVLLMAGSGAEALELLLREPVALALVDVEMPGMDGFELAELMRGTARTRAIPIIFVTAGRHDQSRRFRGYDAGAVDFLAKPLEPHVLRSKVEVFLQLDRQRQQLEDRIDALRRVEARLREADRQKDDFLAALSHELRNPLMPIQHSLHILDQVPAGSEAAARALAVTRRQAAHLTRLVDDLLDVTRIRRGRIELARERLDMADVVRAAADDHRAQFATAGVALDVALPERPVPLDADRTRLAQVVGNLLHNAGKFTPRGGHVTLRLAVDGEHAVLEVRDDGVGIGAETLPRLFQPFAQADRTLARSRGGLGLGLAVVRALVQLHGGGVTVASDGEGRGAAFTVRLPLALDAALPAAPVRVAGPTVRRRVLVVEDNPDGAAVLRETIALLGHDVTVEADGPSALESARRAPPDIVFCDIGLPGMDGYEVARRFREEAALADVPLVAVTGYTQPQDRARALAAGFCEHVPKPPRLEVLGRLLASVGEDRIEAARG